jgi:hypothetical protein
LKLGKINITKRSNFMVMDTGGSCGANLFECFIVVDEYGRALNKAKGIQIYSTEYYAIDQAKEEIRIFDDTKIKACILKCSIVAEVQLEDPVKVKKITLTVSPPLPSPPPCPKGELIIEGETEAS